MKLGPLGCACKGDLPAIGALARKALGAKGAYEGLLAHLSKTLQEAC